MPAARTTISRGGGATLFCSGTTDRRRALIWATVTTLLGSLCTIRLGGRIDWSIQLKRCCSRFAYGGSGIWNCRHGRRRTHRSAGDVTGNADFDDSCTGRRNKRPCTAVGHGDSLENTGEQILRTAAAESNHRAGGHAAHLCRISKNTTGTRAENQHIFLGGRSNCRDSCGDDFGTPTAARGDIICVADTGNHMSATIQRSGSGC